MGCVEIFVGLLKNTKDMETVDQVIWGLGNIAGDCAQFRDKVLNVKFDFFFCMCVVSVNLIFFFCGSLKSRFCEVGMKGELIDHFFFHIEYTGVLEFLLNNLENFSGNMKRNPVWTLSNFCRGRPSAPWEKVSKMLTPLTELLIETRDCEVMADILWALSFITEDKEDDIKIIRNSLTGQEEQMSLQGVRLDAVIHTGVVPKIIKLTKFAIQLGENAWNRIAEVYYCKFFSSTFILLVTNGM
ncbi:importin alpha protein [Reticulomyxa filosa]|uniref:Importin alpha protein n=1 Tax=Reticulomyxa filosa TaxID=46433 RepID=X6LIY9_RETFI|nr:importin alpha protein [Reticulomyxa filosa]|eukprot:ETO00685.1 importin alpha protein [Reticulomyxa filosa]